MNDVFDRFYLDNSWGNRESKSGPGSTLLYTTNIRQEIVRFCRDKAIRSFFDAPCGDFNWMSRVEFPNFIQYIGGDVSQIAVIDAASKFAGGRRTFRTFDITTDKFPQADLWFCRDCFFHLPFSDILRALQNFASSDVKYLFTTTHINTIGFLNTDIAAGGFRLIDLFSDPFQLPREVLFWAADYIHPHPRREMCVWKREQVSNALPGFAAKLAAARESKASGSTAAPASRNSSPPDSVVE